MTKEELEKEAEEFTDTKKSFWRQGRTCIGSVKQAYIAGAEPREKRIAELEEQISVLLSCKNCPDNKGGFICQKEYEDKCLAQKIQYIKELLEENSELKERLLKIENAYKRKSEAEWRLNDLYQKVLTDFANAEKCSREYFSRYRGVIDRLIKAKEIIGELIKFQPYIDREAMFHSIGNEWKIAIYKARQFLKEVEK